MSLFLREYERSMAQYTDAPAVFHTGSAYAIFGALLTRHYHRCVLQGGMPPRWTNLWVFLVGDSGDSRKTTAIAMAQDILRRVDEEMDAPSEGSPEGFLMWLLKREKAQAGNATGVIIAGEMATLLTQWDRAYASSMKPILMEIYDVPPMHKRELVKNSFEIPRPRISMLAGIATELLPSLSESDDWLGGFFSRALVVYGERTRHIARPSTPPDEVMVKHASNVWKALSEWRKSQKKLQRPLFDYAKDALSTVEKLPKPSDDANLRQFLSRAPVHLMKLAAIEQIDEDPTARAIGKKAVERALEYVMYWHRTVPNVLEECFARGQKDMQGDRMAKRVNRYLQRSKDGQASWGDIMRSCALHGPEIRKAVESLLEAGMVENFEKEAAGGKKEVWVKALHHRETTEQAAKAFEDGMKRWSKRGL